MSKIHLVLLLLLAGCNNAPAGMNKSGDGDDEKEKSSTSKSAEPAKPPLSHVIKSDAQYYKVGPQQGRPPDGTFKADTKVRILRETGNYSKVETDDGTSGYVNVDDLEPLEE